jgi:hypothetical protein
MDTGIISQVLGRDVDHSLPPIAGLRISGGFLYFPSCGFMACTGIT